MKANEFVKKFGWGEVIKLLNSIESETGFLLNYSDTCLSPVQLKTDWCCEDELSRYCENESYWVSRSMDKDDEDINDYWFTSVLDLKHLIESHELVESYGGLENAKDEYFSCVQNNEPASYIAKAILEVESCNE